MPNFIKISLFIICVINNLNEWIGKTISWLTLFMVGMTFTIVVFRYVFDAGWIWLQESVSYMHASVFMLGMSYTLKHNKHVRVDIIYQRCSNKTQAWIDCLGTVLLLIPVGIFIIWSSWEYVMEAWRIQESSRNSNGLPAVYVLKTNIIIMASLLILQGIVGFLQNLIIALNLTTE